jgi:hypothetical protein
MKLRSILFSIALGAFAVGCGGNDGEKFGSLADELCKCETEECGEAVREKWEALEDEMKKKYKDSEPDKSVLEAYEKAQDKGRECGVALKEKLQGGDEG